MDKLRAILKECESVYNKSQIDSDYVIIKHVEFTLSDKGYLTATLNELKRVSGQSLSGKIDR